MRLTSFGLARIFLCNIQWSPTTPVSAGSRSIFPITGYIKSGTKKCSPGTWTPTLVPIRPGLVVCNPARPVLTPKVMELLEKNDWEIIWAPKSVLTEKAAALLLQRLAEYELSGCRPQYRLCRGQRDADDRSAGKTRDRGDPGTLLRCRHVRRLSALCHGRCLPAR